MMIRRALAPLAAAFLVMANASTATEHGTSCVVDVESALARAAKTTDVIPLAEGTWIDDIYVMPYSYPESYDRQLPGGLDNIEARQWVAQSFFAHNPDAYDFIAVVTDFTFNAGWGQHGDPTHALYWGVRNDTAGIGLDFYDHSQLFGSHRLQGVIDANSLDLVRDSFGQFDEDHFLTVVSHELGHRWLAHCDFEDTPGSVSTALRGVDDTHWSYLLDSDASYMYGSDWRDNDDGSFTATETKARYSNLDLYLMGMLPADQVGLVTLLANPSVSPDQYPELGATIDATPSLLAVDQIIATEGPRIPSTEDSPHEFKIAMVYLVAPGGQVGTDRLQFLTDARNSWQRRFFAQTEGRGLIGVGRNSLPIVSPSTVDLAAAVNWLISAANASGQWADHPITTGRDTAAAIAALDVVKGFEADVATALDSLAAADDNPTEIEAWRAEALARHERPESGPLLDELMSWILDEGAWGGGRRYAGDMVTTARVAQALSAGGRQVEAQQVLLWIQDRQNEDGGWSWRKSGPSSAAPTLEVIHAATAVDPQNWSQPAIQNAMSWLLARRTQGGFGDPHPNVAQTSAFLASINEQSIDQEIIETAIVFLASRQRSDGSWGGSAYQTAVAVTALAPYVQPDLAILPAELLVEPEDPFTEDPLTLTAAVHSLNGDVAAGVSYRWEVLDSTQSVVATLDGVLPPIPATLFATATDTWDLRHHVSPGTYTFRFSIDPLNELGESNEGNNTADIQVTFRDHAGWIDLELTPDVVHATPSTIGAVPQTVVIDGVARNTGHTDAVDAVIAVFEASSPAVLATTSVTVQRNGEATFQLTIQLEEARPYQITVIADPDDLLNDTDPSNNRVDLVLQVMPVFDPAVVAGSLAVSPTAGIQAGDLVTIGFDLANRGTEPISSLQIGISYTTDDPPTTTAIQLIDVTDPIIPGESRTLTVAWRPPIADPNLTLTVEVDPFQLVDDTDRSNNTAETVLAVDPSLLPNLVANHTAITFDPESALQNEIVHVSATVTNSSDNAAGPFTARLWIDEIGVGTPIGETVIPGLDPGAGTTVDADWLADEMTDRLVWLEVDPNDEVAEFDEDDNRDFRVLDVHTIPDLVVTSGQVSFDPRFPHTGDEVTVEIVVLNTGDQSAADIGLELAVVDGAIIRSTTIPEIAGGDAETVLFDWSTGGAVGTIALQITADPLAAVAELDEDNNTVVLDIAVQDADLWVTEHYISPNNDGVMDSTTIFVRAGIDQIDVVDPWGEVVRVLATSPPGSTEWDGRKQNGATARDGVYELRAGGLVSWVEVDLNGVTITDDIRQPLLTRNVATTSSHPAAEFSSFAPSPVDGFVYLTERLSSTAGDYKIWRWNGEFLEEVLDWPNGHWTIHQVSSMGDVFITQSGDYSLIRFPGPQIEALTPPAYGHAPHLSPDGEWILWERPFSSSYENLVVLQQVTNLGEIVQFGPYSSTSPYPLGCENTIDFAPGGSRVVVGTNDRFASNGLVLDIDLGDTPTVREVPLEQPCWSIQDIGRTQMVFAAVDFDDNIMTCIRDQNHELYTIDLRTGLTLETSELPLNGNSTETWYRLSNDGRVVEVDEYVIPWKKRASISPYFLLDWKRGLTAPWVTGLYGSHQPIWSSRDRYSYSPFPSGGSDHFTYRTPAANLAVALDPVVRFGGAGIDLYITVTDRNLDHFQLEYASASTPETFEPLGRPSRDTLLGENWGTWIPPEKGTWRIRLTAVDLAGNTRSVARWVTWNGVSDIAGLWTESRHISPVASPGVQDEMVWQYTVLRPAQLLFEIHDTAGELIRSIPVGASEVGPRTTTWDGLDGADRPVPDGDYTLTFRGAGWPVTVDNTPPDATFEIAANEIRPTADEIGDASNLDPAVELTRSALFNRSSYSVADDNLDRAIFETRHIDQSTWGPAGEEHFADMSETESRVELVRSELWPERIYRLVATDRAGNTSVAERFHHQDHLGVVFAEPPCRSDHEPCLFPDRPDINEIRDADGLMNDAVAVLWPDYSTLLVQSTVWGDWRSSLRLEFRVPGEGGHPPGDWQPSTILTADSVVWRRVKAPTGNTPIAFANHSAQVLPVYWEHPGLPLRPYEVRMLADNRDGDVIEGPVILVVPKAPLAIEHLSSDAGGDHFRIHNLSTTRIDDISLFASTDGTGWIKAVSVGSLDPGLSVLVNTGCGLLNQVSFGGIVGWVRADGLDPWNAPQSSLPSPLSRGGPPGAASAPSFAMVRGSCGPDAQPPMGMMGYNRNGERILECLSWSCDLGWFTPGGLVDLRVAVPDTDPTGTTVAGYELLIDGTIIAGAPDLAPGTTGRVTLDLSGLSGGDHVVSERYLFAPGEEGMLSSCVESTTLHVDRSAPAISITSPSEGQILCPDQGLVPIEPEPDDNMWETIFTIDGSTTGVITDPVTHVPSILVSALESGSHTLEASVVDFAGNASCHSLDFFTEGIAVATDLAAAPPVFSPVNTMGHPTETIVSFSATAAADYIIEILDDDDSPMAASDGGVAPGETISLVWDGREEGEPVPDGEYRIKIRLVSDCGAIYETQEPLPTITIDTTAPVMVVTSPYPLSAIVTALELQALITDINLDFWEARIRPTPPIPGDWVVFASGDRPSTDPNNVLARWSTTHLSAGAYEVEVEAIDEPGNLTATSIPVQITDPRIIASFRTDPIYISPNGDGAADETLFSFELLREAGVLLSSEGWIDLIEYQVLPPGTPHTATWAGLDPDGNPAPDGPYQFELQADAAGEDEEFEATTVIVDRVAPTVEVSSPPNGILTSLPITVSGFSFDPHADDYSVVLEHPVGTLEELAADPGDWAPGEVFTLEDLPDGEYRVRATATDLAENTTTVEHVVTIDNTAPSARITAPSAGQFLDPSTEPLVFRGVIAAAHPESFTWWIAEGASTEPTDFVILDEQVPAAAGPVEHEWFGPPPDDGVHTIRLTTIDQLGRSSEDRRVVTIDGEAPVVELWAPAGGALVTEPIIITGLVDDDNLTHWTLEEITTAPTARILAAGSSPVQDELIIWDPLPTDGPVTLRLTGYDAAGHVAEASVGVEVSVLPPGAPVGLTAEIVGHRDIALNWLPGPGPTPVGYHVVRDEIRITAAPISQPSLVDSQVLDGVYTYRVTAIGPHGRESDPSVPATIVVNLSPPDVALTSPAAGSRIGSEVTIYGTAFAADDFGFWEIAARAAGAPAWVVLETATSPVIGGFMTNWATHLPPWSDGDHELRLIAEDVVGNRAESLVLVFIDNTAPDPGPINLDAVLTALDPDSLGNDVQLTWVQNPVPPDLAGFYLYRNGLLANAPGPVVGDPSPYLLTGTSFDDRDVPDGTYTYGVAAADTAGNISSLSNPAGPITIDTRRPHAVITSPADGTEIEVSVEVIAECEDEDVVSLDLEYRLESQPSWTRMAPTFSGPPFVAVFSPPEHGRYFVRALASDVGGPDPTPDIIEITAADLPPQAPLQLKASADGDEVTLSWIAPPDPDDDLAGYDLERNGIIENGALLPPDTRIYLDAGLPDGSYDYRIFTVDGSDQRTASDPVSISVHTPFWGWIAPVASRTHVTLSGGGVHAFGTVEILAFNPAEGTVTAAVIEADGGGVFEVEDVPLITGVNSFTAWSTNDNGDTSRVSPPLLLVAGQPPQPIENLGVEPSGSDVILNWTSSEAESAGFEITRSDSVINEVESGWPHDSMSHALTASSADPSSWSLVVDGDTGTGWTPEFVPSRGRPEWWSWMWPEAIEIDEIVIGWSSTDPPQIYDIDVMTPGGWLWLASESWNGQPTVALPVGLTTTGVRVRLPETGACGTVACVPTLTTIELSRRQRTLAQTYIDEGLANGVYPYEVRERNTWGQWSFSASTSAVVGPDQPSPPSDLTVNPVDCGGLELQWQPAASQPGTLSSFRVYRRDGPSGPFEFFTSRPASQPSVVDAAAPVGSERFYILTSLVIMEGVAVESVASPPSSGTAVCINPPPPVITEPTIAGQLITIAPSQVPFDVRGTAVSGSTLTLLHDGAEVETKNGYPIFRFFDVEAHAGANTYVVRQTLQGNITESAPIEVVVDSNLVPDAEAISLTVSPAATAPGELVMAEGTIALHASNGEPAAFDIAFELVDPAGVVSEVYRTSLLVATNDIATVRVPWIAIDSPGIYDWRLVVDPENDLMELNEDNNVAAATSRVLDGHGLELDVRIDRPSYFVGQQLTGTVFFASSDEPEDYLLETRLEDSAGRSVAVIDSRSLATFGGGWLEFDLGHPLIGLYPGLYRVRTLALVDGSPAIEVMTPFQLEEPVFLEAEVFTDRSTYSEGLPVFVNGRIHNLGPTVVDGLDATLSVVNETTSHIEAEDHVHGVAIAAGGTSEVQWSWPTSGALPGPYRATLVVSDPAGSTLVVAEPFAFTVVPGEVRLSAEIELSASPVEPGDPVAVSVRVENTGSADLPALDLTIALIDPIAIEVVDEHIHAVSLAAGAGHHIDQPLGTTSLVIQRYVVLVTASGDDGRGPFSADLGSTTLDVADLSPPNVVVIEPSSDGVACEEVVIEADVVDAFSRIDRVYYHLDDETTALPLHLRDAATDPDSYTANRPLPPGEDGPHVVTVFAEDTAGNSSAGEVVTFDTDTASPLLQVVGPAHDSCSTGGVSFVYSATDDHLVSLAALLDGESYPSGAVIWIEGPHFFAVTAADACGRSARETRSFVIDATAPEIHVAGVAQGAQIAPGTTLDWWVDDANLTTVAATLNGIPIGTSVVLDTTGEHSLHITATDCADNTAELTMEFSVTAATLALAGGATAAPSVIEPAQVLDISGLVMNSGTDLVAVELTLVVVQDSSGLTVATHSETTDLISGQAHTTAFSPDTSGWELGLHEIRYSARGLFLGQPFEIDLATATVTMADLTPPQLAVLSPAAGLACATVEVIVEATDNLTGVSSVAVAADGGTVLPLTHAGGATWSIPLSLDEGVHQLQVTATDGGGNSSMPVTIDIELDTEAPQLSVTAPNDGTCISEETAIEFSADDPHLDEIAALLNGSPISSGHVVAEDAEYTLEVTANDTCGLQTTETRDFVIDTTDPEIVVTGFADDEIHATGVPGEWSATDDNLISATATLDGTPADQSFTVATVGHHLLEVAVADCADNSAALSVAFQTVAAEDGLSGVLGVEPLQLEPPTTLQATATATNVIDTNYTGVTLRLEIIDPTTGAAVREYETVTDLSTGADVVIDHDFTTDGLRLGEYELRFSAVGTVFDHAYVAELAIGTFEVVDLTPPAMSIITPASGLGCESIEVRASALDSLSGVESVHLSVDDDPVGLSLMSLGDDLWSIGLTLPDGVHQLEVSAVDVSGNQSDPINIGIDLDLTPPVLSVSAPVDGECLAESVTITFDAEDDHLEEVTANLNGSPVHSGDLISADGDHSLRVAASDLCSRIDVYNSTFIIDTTPPTITITGVTDGGEFQSPVDIDWAVTDANLTSHSAMVDGNAVEPPLRIEEPGAHVVVVEAEDCAGNNRRSEISFTVVEDPTSGLVVDPPSLDADGSILLLDRSPSGGEDLEAWLAERVGRVIRVTDGCSFINELRRSLYEAVILYAPTGSAPLDLGSCPDNPDLPQLSAELGAAAFRNRAILVLGEGMEGAGCLGCGLRATGAEPGNRILDRIEVRGTTSILEPAEGTAIFDLRPSELMEGLPILLGIGDGPSECDGLSSVTLELDPGLGGPWTVVVGASTPHENLDRESGLLADGQTLDSSTHPWVDLSAARLEDTLEITFRSVLGGALPDWLSVEATVWDTNRRIETSAWLPIGCGLGLGEVFNLMEVTAVDVIGHAESQNVAASVRRYGRGEALVLPWDVLAPANAESLCLVEQALAFSLPGEPWPAISGLPLPVSITLRNDGSRSLELRLEAMVPPDLLFEAWSDPLILDPVRWEIAIDPGSAATRTVWILPDETSPITIPFTVSVLDDEDWRVVHTEDLRIDIEIIDRRVALRRLRTTLDDCAASTNDPAVQATLRDVLAAVERAADVGDDSEAIARALRELAVAFAAAEDERLPCLAELRGQVADLMALWQARWTMIGSSP